MDRLTYVTEDGTVLFSPDGEDSVTIKDISLMGDIEYLEKIADTLANREFAAMFYERKYNDVCKELKAYEDTGLTPEQIQGMDKSFSEQAKELMGYKNAESQGTLIRVPVAKGSRVYEIIDDGVDKAYIQGIKVQEVSDSRIWANDACFDYDDIGRTIFLSPREAAESICKNKWTYLTNQEVINVMAKYTDEHVSRVVSRAHIIAIGALEKQIPKKPTKVDNPGIRYTDTYRCPSCGGNFTGTGFADYCYHCGQHLDWEDQP